MLASTNDSVLMTFLGWQTSPNIPLPGVNLCVISYLNPLRPLLMEGTTGHRWFVAQPGTRVVPKPKAMDMERMNLDR